jgi:hypothetical protein
MRPDVKTGGGERWQANSVVKGESEPQGEGRDEVRCPGEMKPNATR